MTPAEHARLLAFARAAIRDRLLGGDALASLRAAAPLTPALRAPGAAFVTLKLREDPARPARLRGCIGTLEASGPLHEAVARFACESAFGDPRFPPLAAAELEHLEIEISVLGAPHAVDGPDAIAPGRHGVMLDKPPHRAVFLPQVATEQGWGVTELLEHLALKAGLRRDGWRGARLSVFEADVF
jgi:AmmeMemoRadiSam system protein A